LELLGDGAVKVGVFVVAAVAAAATAAGLCKSTYSQGSGQQGGKNIQSQGK
jgi:hypothetical protein